MGLSRLHQGGRTIYAVGSNKEAARAAGLNTLFYSVLPYVLSGALSAVAATFSISQILSADPLMGNSMELDAIAAVVIGGASLYGGRGSMIGTLFGVFIMVMISKWLEPDGSLTVLAGLSYRNHHHRRPPGRAARQQQGQSMSTEASRAIKLFGTEEPINPLRILKAGELTAELDGGNLRHIRYSGTEVIRAVSFIVRDRNWGTYNPDIEDLKIEETPDRFAVTYTALARDERQRFRYSARIEGTAKGQLEFVADGRAETDFLTNRTGFVVLHPCEVAGRPVTIEHADGSVEQDRFPEEIDPVQPMLNLRELSHEAAPGLRVTCRMEGDVYEMEDQRNWTDASYKTYVRPLALPWPYTLTKGETLAQAVRLTLKGPAPRAASRASNITLAVGANLRAVPPLGLGLHPNDIATTRRSAETLRLVGANHVIGFYDPREGHDRGTLLAVSETAAALGGQPWLEAVITSVEGFRDELAALGREVARLGSPFPIVLVSPAPDLKCTLPGSPWPPAPPPREFFTAARAAFPGVRLGGGMFSYFTELNRKRPPIDLLDLVSFTTTASLHAGDDHSITEGLESVPAMALTAAKIAGGKPGWLDQVRSACG
ncbi:ABC transporter permease [Bradyrhizobium sp. RDM4]|uniref:ABC transporter permease n=1 Tax=Bradyrhizobium sp. RDM4 TaxID=3378765 RepID=UPI0038FD1319